MLVLLNLSPQAVFCCVTPESGQFDPDSAPHTHHAEPDGQVLTYRGTSENVCHIVLCQSNLAFTAPLFHYHPICPPAGAARHTHTSFFSAVTKQVFFLPFVSHQLILSHRITAHAHLEYSTNMHNFCFQLIFYIEWCIRIVLLRYSCFDFTSCMHYIALSTCITYNPLYTFTLFKLCYMQ